VNAAPALPHGFEPHFRKSPVTEPWEPLYSRPSAEGVELGLIVAHTHCNSRGFVHGGVIAALADNAMGLSYGVVRSRSGLDSAPRSGAVTVSLGLDYTASAKIGQWLQITPRVLKAGRSMGFVDALVTADGDVVARASATFRLVE
jgi:acyl-coenzyme A thioesterase PaaI-like protein